MRVNTLPPLRRVGLAGLVLAACQAPPPPAREPASQPRTPPTEAAIGQAAVAAVVAAPWDRDPAGWGTLCSPAAPCDTVVVEPRIVALPAQAPAFFVPEARELAATLTPYTLTLSQVPAGTPGSGHGGNAAVAEIIRRGASSASRASPWGSPDRRTRARRR